MTLEEDSGSETSSGEVRTNSEGSSSHSDIDESEEEEQPWTSEDLEKELEVLVGLDELKRHLRRWCKGLLLDRQRRKLGIDIKKRMAPNMVFLGNPGTGKTSVARILARILHKLKVLRRNVVVEVQRTDLVGEYIGQTGIKTRQALERAKGGVLFVDEAYRLMVPGCSIDFGREALEEIMSQMDSGKLMCIFAGYEKPMKRVLDCNEGFRRRVGKQFVFSDYTAEQIADIMLIKMTSPEASHPMPGFRLSKGCTRQKLGRLIQTRIPQTERQQRNGGLAMTLLQEARDHLDERLSLQCSDRDALMTITMRDFGAAADGVSAMACGPTKKPRF